MAMRVERSNETYDIKIAESHHLPDVLRVMRENFYHEETMFESLCSNVTMTNSEKKQIDEYFDSTITAAFEASPCVIAVHEETLRVVGANITALSENSNTGSKTDGLEAIFSREHRAPSPLVTKYIEYLSKINNEARLFDVFPDSRVFMEFYAIAIDKNHRRLGLASDLISVGIGIARQVNASLVFGVFTSVHSKRSAEKVGMRALMEFDLSKYYEEDGRRVFQNTGSNSIATVMVLEL